MVSKFFTISTVKYPGFWVLAHQVKSLSKMKNTTQLPISCQLLADVNAGGIQKECIDITRALVKADAAAPVLVCSNGGLLLHDMLRTGARHLLLPITSRNPFRAMINGWKIRWLARRLKVTLLHLHSPGLARIATRAHRRGHTRLLATVHAMTAANKSATRHYLKFLKRCDRVIAVSGFVAEQLAEAGIEKERIELIPRGIDTVRFNPDTTRAHRLIELAAKWRLPDGVPLIIVPSRLSEGGGQAFLVEALAHLKSLNKTQKMAFTCLFMGDEAVNPAYRQKMEALITEHKLEGQLRFVGFCDDMPAAYALADVVIAPAVTPEPFGRVAVEAQAMGRVVISAAHGAALETIVNGVTGYLFKAGDRDDLIATLKQALTLKPATRKAMAAAARAHVLKNYPVEEMCRKTVALYKALNLA